MTPDPTVGNTTTKEMFALKDIKIPFEQFTLTNGLTVIVSEDHSSSEVEYSLIHKMGSRDERPGKTGLAHLYEHMLFRPTEKRPLPFMEALRQVGGSAQGATTSDYTLFFAGMPVAAFEHVMWLEADRMANLAPTLTQKDLDEERRVVINELRQMMHAAGGMKSTYAFEGLFPVGHPYRWTPGGSIPDLEKMTVEDLQDWHRRFHGPNNAFFVICGDITLAQVQTVFEQYFSSIAPLAPQSRHAGWVAERRHNSSFDYCDYVGSTEITRYWSVAAGNSREAYQLSVLTALLRSPDNNPLHQYLVEDRQLATRVRLSHTPLDLTGILSLAVQLKDGAKLEDVSAAIDTACSQFLDGGLKPELLENHVRANYIKQVKALTKPFRKNTMLMEGMLTSNDAGFFKQQNQWLAQLTTEDMLNTARKWMATGYHQLNLKPYGKLQASEAGTGIQSAPPTVVKPVQAKAPKVQETLLANGIKLRLIDDQRAPLSTLQLLFKRGQTHAAVAAPGAAEQMITQLKKYIAATTQPVNLQSIGAVIVPRLQEMSTLIRIEALNDDLADVFKFAAHFFKNPAYQSDARKDHTVRVEKPLEIGSYMQKFLLFGAAHPYGVLDDSETSADKQVLEQIHRDIFRPELLTIVVSSSLAIEQLKALLDRDIGRWQSVGECQESTELPAPQLATAAKVILLDAPGTVQSDIKLCCAIEWESPEEREVFSIANQIFGRGDGRLVQNLRTEKGWTYGLYSDLQTQPQQSVWTTRGTVQTDKTAASMAEIWREFTGFATTHPATDTEVKELLEKELLRLPKQVDSVANKLRYLLDNVLHERDDQHIERLAKNLESVNANSVLKVWQKHLPVDKLVWIISGDLAKIESEIRALGLGPVEVRTVVGIEEQAKCQQ